MNKNIKIINKKMPEYKYSSKNKKLKKKSKRKLNKNIAHNLFLILIQLTGFTYEYIQHSLTIPTTYPSPPP